jgi:hypothetical protein
MIAAAVGGEAPRKDCILLIYGSLSRFDPAKAYFSMQNCGT